MKKRVLMECQNLTLTTGTGIATYARNLAQGVKAEGYSTAALFGTDKALDVGASGALDEIMLADATPRHQPFLMREVQKLYRAGWADRSGVVPRHIKRSGIVATPGSMALDAAFDDLHAVHDLTERARRLFMRHQMLMQVQNTMQAHLFHATHITPMMVAGIPNLCTIHDIIPLRLPNVTLDNKKYFHDVLKKIVEKMDIIVTVSDYSKSDIVRFLGVREEKVVNTYQSVSVSPEILNADEEDVAREVHDAYALEHRGYYLFFGAIEPKKNVSRLVDAYAASGTKRPLVLCGHFGWQYDADMKRIQDERFVSYRIKDNEITRHRAVQHLDYVPRASLLRLIRSARAVVFPSLYEGFGLPVLEAMSLGTPVITSNTTSLPEIAGDAALLVDPYDEAAIARAIRTLDKDDDLCADLARRGRARAAFFSQENYQRRIADLYARVL